MQLKDVAHFYLKTGVQWHIFNEKQDGELEFYMVGRLVSVRPETDHNFPLGFLAKPPRLNREIDWYCPCELVKPILRSIESLAETEAKELRTLTCSAYLPNQILGLWAERVDWHLKRGFDIFGLIPAGLAVDASTLQTDEN